MKGTSERIAKTCLGIIEERGPEAVTMRGVAKVLGITPMALYHHFENREALLHFVTDREFKKLTDYMHAGRNRSGKYAPLLHIMDYYIDYAFAHPRVFGYMFSQRRLDARQFPRDFVARRSPTMNVVADTVSAAMRLGIIRRGNVWEIALELWAHIHGYIALQQAGRFELSERQFRQLCRRSLERLIYGLKS